ncbi:UDP-N-acetylglucosamine 2-epimerase [Enterovibrio sp. ZSDZ42]|uniref:UDP-N-acetylglucosamine 2-epimerase n=1 Tax=Enterovibrio gelatinilyticus TaxID=2899819 RepID=A0ABT5R6Z0_9GAMM|nr:UDP-N-acetylglucosamine 2-epimerase [Enterovibrio sp. ZSDZ42]MDD1796039.1 UDP-N-acetylglucosamine 2-epimerase [Enterovibrio sp. ZSDZ42]
MNKKILFLTGTRADFGKLKSLISKVEKTNGLDAYVFVTGMHMMSKYGMTSIEVDKAGFKNIYKYINQSSGDSMDIVLSKTVSGLSDYIKELRPDMIVIHGDRVEALAGAIVGSLNNILVSHIEGGEVSGTIDELIRHSVSKLSHIHYVCNERARKRLIQLGEREDSIFVIGSPDLDIMLSPELPTLDNVKEKYEFDFKDFAIFMYHPVTTDLENLGQKIKNVVDALLMSNENFIVVYPNNDDGSDVIINEFKRLEGNSNFKVFPSIRFECFLVMLKNAKYMIGNSSAGVREAPFYGLPTIDLGTRQNNRSSAKSIINTEEITDDILTAITISSGREFKPFVEFGSGNSDEKFIETIIEGGAWETSKQKIFSDLPL